MLIRTRAPTVISIRIGRSIRVGVRHAIVTTIDTVGRISAQTLKTYFLLTDRI